PELETRGSGLWARGSGLGARMVAWGRDLEARDLELEASGSASLQPVPPSLEPLASRCGMAIAARAPNTSPSSSELLARRFAPCTPVHATSPAANRPASDVRPHSSVSTPPIM